MKFGIREITNVMMKAKSTMRLGNKVYYKDEPVLYFDSLKTSSLEGAATTVYAQGGRGNSRLIAWEGERTLTFNMEDALLSPESFAVLSGAGLIEKTQQSFVQNVNGTALNFFNKTVDITSFLPKDIALEDLKIIKCSIDLDPLNQKLQENDIDFIFDSTNTKITCSIDSGSVYLFCEVGEIGEDIMSLIEDVRLKSSILFEVQTITGYEHIIENTEVTGLGNPIMMLQSKLSKKPAGEIFFKSKKNFFKGFPMSSFSISTGQIIGTVVYDQIKEHYGNSIFTGPAIADYYTPIYNKTVKQLTIDPNLFGSNFYLEADTLFRDTYGADHAATFIIPNCKVQSNFTFTMASSGDPSTFSFVLDAFPGYTRFDSSKKVLAALQINEKSINEEI